mmetsp:Transcript_19215/g.31531  ORF Transcript_19215/g.31531 Transcript_19215/m.31531 type:complete len:323 (-) Transcript_19215:24-992(-)
MESQLYAKFAEFSNFGNRGPFTDGHEVMMDSRACQKLAKDCRLISKSLTTTDVDLIFTKVKAMGERKISFAQFIECTRFWALKVKKSHAELVVAICSSDGPAVHLSTPRQAVAKPTKSKPPAPVPKAPVQGKAVPRLHPDWYEVQNTQSTGDHDRVYYVNSKTNATSWEAPILIATDAVVPPPPPPKSQGNIPPKNSHPSKAYPSAQATLPAPVKNPPSDKSLARSIGRRRASLRFNAAKEEEETKVHESIFDKLTDPSLYTGAHRHRFDSTTGKGKGIAGRDRISKGDGTNANSRRVSYAGNTNTNTDQTIHDISQVLRYP